jgi:hypothetical protein
MAVTLIGIIVNSADAITGFNQGNISTDDDFVEGIGAIGLKASTGLTEIYTTSIGSGPYDFSSGGGEFGFHVIMWFNTKTPIDTTAGLRIVVGNGTDRGNWDVDPAGFYKGGFVTKVVDTARDFNTITAGTWTTTGNPAQLSNITQVGGAFTTLTAIMGNFNNIQLDQMTIGEGLRADAGTIGTPNTFETVRAADEDTAFYGWWGSSNGAYLGKGKLYIGPSTGSATSVFADLASSVVFADERVAIGFYEINTRGAGTDVSFDLISISSANSASARWNLTIQSDTNSFSDTNGVWKGADQILLSDSSTLTGTTLVNCTSLTQNSATLTNIAVLDANTTDGAAFIQSDNLSLITNSTFEFSDGHAIELIAAPGSPQTVNATNLEFVGYGADGTNDAAIFNNTGGHVIINSAGSTGLTVRNGVGASTTVVADPVTTLISVIDAVTGLPVSNARVYLHDTGSPITTYIFGSQGTLTAANGEVSDSRVLGGDLPVTGWVRRSTLTLGSPSLETRYKTGNIVGTIDSDTGLTVTVQLIPDE